MKSRPFSLLLIVCRLRGDIAQYDITDPEHPKLAGRVWLGGCCRKGGPYKVLPCMLLSLYAAVMALKIAPF